MMKHDLSSCALFRDMPDAVIREVVERSVSDVRVVDKGGYVARQGDTIQFLHLLVEGLVRTEMVTKEGNLLEIEFLEPVRPLAPAFIFASNNRFPVDVIAIEKSTFYRVSKSDWLLEMMANEKLMHNFMQLNSNMTVFLSNKVHLMSIKSLKGKIALYVMENTDTGKNYFTLKRTQTQLAEYFGVQRPSLARTLSEMINEGIISLHKRELTVLDRNKLEKLI